MPIRQAAWLAVSLSAITACSSKGGGPPDASCPAGQSLLYVSPGCGASAPRPMCVGAVDACNTGVCTCSGKTVNGCGYAKEPWSHERSCSEAGSADVPPDMPPDVPPDMPPDLSLDVSPDLLPDMPPDVSPDRPADAGGQCMRELGHPGDRRCPPTFADVALVACPRRTSVCGSFLVYQGNYSLDRFVCYYDGTTEVLVATTYCADYPAFCGGTSFCVRAGTSVGACACHDVFFGGACPAEPPARIPSCDADAGADQSQ